jgi:peroxiredoxin
LFGAVLEPGDKAPAFTLPDQDGNKVKLWDFKGETVVLYFYPRADTLGWGWSPSTYSSRLGGR